jgi:hypothetical protein
MRRGCCDGRRGRKQKILSFLSYKNDGEDVYMDESVQAMSDLSFFLFFYFLFFLFSFFFFFSPFFFFSFLLLDVCKVLLRRRRVWSVG